MEEPLEAGPGRAEDARLLRRVPGFGRLNAADRSRLCEMAAELEERGMPEAFIIASLCATADVLQELRDDEDRGDNVFRREQVQRFIEQNAVPRGAVQGRPNLRRERKREERERLQAQIAQIIREARLARGRHEVKKTRNMLLRVDQRELRRVLGAEGDELCRQINTWLRSAASMF